MKRILLSIALLSSVYLSAQETVIIDKKFGEKDLPVSFEYLPISQKFVFFSGEKITMTGSSFTTTASAFDGNGKESKLFENQKYFSCSYSSTENSFMNIDIEKSIWTYNYKIFIKDQIVEMGSEKIKDMSFNYFGNNINGVTIANGQGGRGTIDGAFNDFYLLGFSNQKRKDKVDFEKDDVFLEVIEFKTGSRNRFQIEKPDLTTLKGDSFAKTEHKVSFTCKLNGNDNFDLITKSISKDFQTVIIYKTTYDFGGKKVKMIPLTLKIENNFFVTSDNGGGPQISTANGGTKLDGLSINNYFEDRKNGDLYVFGIFSDESQKKIGGSIHPKGYYVFKFDKDGNKLWESINNIDGKDFLERIHYAPGLDVRLAEYKENLVFSVSVNDFTEFTNAAIVDKTNGAILKSSFLEYNNNTAHEKFSAFINNTYDYKELRNKSFSPIAFAAMTLNENLFKYLKNIPEGDKRLHFSTLFSNQGIWLVETDNKEYYKVLLFK
jgi:hypothetical protein